MDGGFATWGIADAQSNGVQAGGLLREVSMLIGADWLRCSPHRALQLRLHDENLGNEARFACLEHALERRLGMFCQVGGEKLQSHF